MRKYPPTAISENVIKNISSQSLNVRNGERAYDNSTPNTDTNQDILFQGGADRGMFSREHNLIALLKNADASTFVHELGHFFLETNTRIARDLTAKPAENLTGQERQFLSDVPDDLGLVRRERPCRMGRNESKRAAREPREMGARFLKPTCTKAKHQAKNCAGYSAVSVHS